MQSIIFFCLGLGWLLFLSFLDLKYQKVDNRLIGVYLIIGLIIQGVVGNIVPSLLGGLLMMAFGYILWHFKTIGGADAKLLPVVVVWLPISGMANTLITLLFFITVYGIVGSLYGYIYGKLYSKKQRYIPHIPIITLTYVIVWLLNIH